MLERFKTGIERLADMPRLSGVLPTNDLSLVEGGYSYLVIEPYIVFYRDLGAENLVWPGTAFPAGLAKHTV